MKQEYENLMNRHLEALCSRMNMAAVLSRLVKSGMFTQDDLERVEHETTMQDKNTLIVDILATERDFDALSEFLRVLASIDHTHYDLATELQPVRHRIAWFAPSPTHAAAVVHALEKYAGARFSKMSREGERKSLVVRRARVFPKEFDPKEQKDVLDVQEVVKSSHQTEVCLAFPATQTDVSGTLRSWFGEGLAAGADLVLMSSVCGDMVGGRGERAVVVTEAQSGRGERVCAGIDGEGMESLKTQLSRSLAAGEGEEWMAKECGASDSGKPRVEFRVLSQHLPAEEEAAPKLALTGSCCSIKDTLPFLFYSLSQQHCPGQCSLLCVGIPPSVSGEVGSESTAAVACSCFLMEICRHFFPPLDPISVDSDSD